MSLPDALERAASELASDAEAIRPANGDPARLLELLDPEAAARVLAWLAAAAWIALSAALLLAFAVWSLVSGMPLATAGAFGLIWVALSAPPALVVFRTRRHRRP